MQREGGETNRRRPAILAGQGGKRRARCQEEPDDRQGVGALGRQRPQRQGPDRDLQPGLAKWIELDRVTSLVLTDPAQHVTGCQLSPEDLRSRHMKRVVDTGKGIGETNGPLRGGDLCRKREDSHANGDVQGHQPKRHPPDPARRRPVWISTGDHISAEVSAADSGGASRRASASQKATAAMTSAMMAAAVTRRISGPDAP